MARLSEQAPRLEKSDEVQPVGTGQFAGELAQVDEVNPQQPEQQDGLPPLRGVAPEHARILHQQRARRRIHPEQASNDFFRQALAVVEVLLPPGGSAEPFPLAPDAGAAVHPGHALVIKIAQPCIRQQPKEQHVAPEAPARRTSPGTARLRPIAERSWSASNSAKTETTRTGFSGAVDPAHRGRACPACHPSPSWNATKSAPATATRRPARRRRFGTNVGPAYRPRLSAIQAPATPGSTINMAIKATVAG